MMTGKLLIAATVFCSGSLSFAHGEDKPGPHGGLIRMPGAFHTEVIHLGANKLKVFLLDINWKNPSVRDSKVQVTFSGKMKSEASCSEEADAFVCTFDRGVDLNSQGKLILGATREKQRGAVVEYTTPL